MASADPSASGMSLLELLLAVTMMMVFTGVIAAVMEVSLRFMGEAECPVDLNGEPSCNDENTDSQDVANGALIDRQRIEALFDQLEPIWFNRGYTVLESIKFRVLWLMFPVKCAPRIVYICLDFR